MLLPCWARSHSAGHAHTSWTTSPQPQSNRADWPSTEASKTLSRGHFLLPLLILSGTLLQVTESRTRSPENTFTTGHPTVPRSHTPVSRLFLVFTLEKFPFWRPPEKAPQLSLPDGYKVGQEVVENDVLQLMPTKWGTEAIGDTHTGLQVFRPALLIICSLSAKYLVNNGVPACFKLLLCNHEIWTYSLWTNHV